jgi:MFS family permease
MPAAIAAHAPAFPSVIRLSVSQDAVRSFFDLVPVQPHGFFVSRFKMFFARSTTSQARHKIRRNLICSTYEGSCYSLMVGLSETYFAAFYIAVGMSEFGVGMLATVPYLIGAAVQLLTPWGVNKTGSYRRWTIATAATQGFSLLTLAVLTAFGKVSFPVLLAIASIYWASGLATGPAWNTWIEFVVPKKIRARYFSVRMRICQLCLLAAITSAGFLLRTVHDGSERMLLFAGLFCVAGLLRLLSSSALSRQVEQRHWLPSNFAALRAGGVDNDPGPLIQATLPFFAAMQFAVYISGPFFAPFMLKNLGLGYLPYMVLILLGYFGRVMAMPMAGRLAKQHGPVRLMMIGAIGIIPMSSLWWFHESFTALCLVQTASGAAWGCYELGMSLVFIERIPGHHRMRVLSWFNTFNGVAMVAGSVLGGWLIQGLGSTNSAFMVAFLLSGICRIVAFARFPFSMLSEPGRSSETGGQPWQVSSPMLNGRSIVRPFYIPPANAIPAPSVTRVASDAAMDADLARVATTAGVAGERAIVAADQDTASGSRRPAPLSGIPSSLSLDPPGHHAKE